MWKRFIFVMKRFKLIEHRNTVFKLNVCARVKIPLAKSKSHNLYKENNRQVPWMEKVYLARRRNYWVSTKKEHFRKAIFSCFGASDPILKYLICPPLIC